MVRFSKAGKGVASTLVRRVEKRKIVERITAATSPSLRRKMLRMKDSFENECLLRTNVGELILFGSEHTIYKVMAKIESRRRNKHGTIEMGCLKLG